MKHLSSLEIMEVTGGMDFTGARMSENVIDAQNPNNVTHNGQSLGATPSANENDNGGTSIGINGMGMSPSANENDNGGSSTGIGGFGGVNSGFGISSSYSGGGGGGGKVICTELCRNGVIEHDVWMADIRYSQKNFSEQTIRGYHLWGVPYVRLMRKYPAFAKFAAYPTRWFADDIAYRMGVRATPNYAGWALRELAFRPICWSIGIVAKARDWQALWAQGTVQAMTGARFA
jgi:hypothetical protein